MVVLLLSVLLLLLSVLLLLLLLVLTLLLLWERAMAQEASPLGWTGVPQQTLATQDVQLLGKQLVLFQKSHVKEGAARSGAAQC